MKTWTAYIQKDGDDLILPFPDDLLQELNWKEGDVLEWDVRPDGSIVLTRKVTIWTKVKEWFAWRL